MSDLLLNDALPVSIPAPIVQSPAEPAPSGDVATRFSGENARLMALRSAEARRAKALAAKQAASLPKPEPIPQPAPVVPTPAQSPFALEQLQVVRARMNDIDEALRHELGKDSPEGTQRTPDANKVDRLASAWSKFAEQERILDGRPLPGSRKPANEPSTKRKPFNMQVE